MTSCQRLIFVIRLFSLLLFWRIQWAVASTASASSASSYVSVRALDKYGHSEQLQNALKAANLHGTLVIAAHDSTRNATLVLSWIETSSKDQAKVQKPHIALQSLDFTDQTAMVCTGLRGDARWLLNEAREYTHRVWTRYNTFVTPNGLAFGVASKMRKFWGYDCRSEFKPGLLDTNGDREVMWGRPLGVVALIVSSQVPYVLVVEPSGVIQRYTAFVMGRHSSSILEKLGKLMHKMEGENSLENDLETRLLGLIEEEAAFSKKNSNVLIEVLSEDGLDRKEVSIPQKI